MNEQKLPKHVELMQDEQLVEMIHPHPLSFYRTYAVWGILLLIGIVMFIFQDFIISLFPASHFNFPIEIINIILAGQGGMQIGYDLLSPATRDSLLLVTAWWYVLMILGGAVALSKVNGAWILAFLSIGGVSTIAGVLLGTLSLIPLFGSALCLIGIALTEGYRRAHCFIITSARLIMHVDYFHYQERDLLLSRLSDLAIDQTFVGRVFNFATLIPISLSGFGLGTDMSFVGVGGQIGPVAVGGALGKSIGVPRARSPHVLFGVRDPHRVHAVLQQLINTNSEVKNLQVIQTELKRMKFLTDK